MRHVKAVAMASSVTQWSSGSSYAPASIAVSWPAAPASGDVLIVAFWNNGQSSGAANTYTPPAGWSAIDTNASHAYATYEVFEHVASAGEPNSYTFTPQAAQREHAWIAADVSSASGVDQAGDAFVNNGTAYTTPSLTPAQAGEFAIAFNAPMTLSAVTWSNPSSWTLGTGPSPTWHGEAISQALSGTAQISAASTLSSAASGFAGIVLLAPSASQPTATPSPTPTPSMTPSPAPTPTPSSTPGGGGGAAPAPAQWSSGASFAPASIAVSLAAAPAPGDLLIVAFWNNGQSSGAANTYAPPAGWSIVDENTSHIYATFEAFSHVVGAGESNRYAFTPQAAQREQAWIALDVGNAAGVDKGSDAYVSGSTYSPPALSPAQSGELAVVFNVPMVLSGVTWSNPASWTLGTGPTSPWHGEAVYQGVSSAPVTESSTLSAAASGFSAIVLVAGSSAPPTPTPTPSAVPQTVDWSTMGFDNQRTGYNPNEKTLGPSSFGSLHALWSSPPSVGYQMVGEPVLATNVTVSGSSRNLLYAGGQSGVFYAIDADTGAIVWSKQLGSGSYTCSGGGSSAFGIEGAAALDRARNRVYVPDGLNQVHALDLSTGAEASGWPASIASSTGHDFIYAGLTFNPNNGVLYAETSSTCDISPWYGRISAINTATGAVTATFYPTQGSSGGGIWGFGGASIDPSTNDVFIATGNADGATQNAYYSEQIVELTPDLSSVIAANYPNIPSADDSDFGATPLLFQPPGCPPLLAAVNKSGAFVLYNRTSISSGPVQMILMSVANSTGSFIGVPSYDPVTNDVYVGLPSTFGIYKPGAAAFGITGSCTLNPTPVWNAVFGPDVAGTTNDAPRSPITIANGVVYVSGYSDDTTYAFDASSGAKLWSSPLNDIGIVGPVVANGRLYVGDYGGTIHAWQP